MIITVCYLLRVAFSDRVVTSIPKEAPGKALKPALEYEMTCHSFLVSS